METEPTSEVPAVLRPAPSPTPAVSIRMIERRIFFVRGEKVMLDSDLAELYGVSTKRFNEAVKRNLDRFPEDFMFQTTKEEIGSMRFQYGTSNLRSQFATSSYGGRRYAPYAFTEHGIAMLSSVLNSKRAVAVNIEIIRTFIKLRELLATHADLAAKLKRLEERYDETFVEVFRAIHRLMTEPENPNKEKMGFRTD